MKKLIPFFAAGMILATSCKKNSSDLMPVALHPGNEVKATLSLSWIGSGATPYTATGDNASFIRRIGASGDTVITISGSHVNLYLQNVNAAGTYTVGTFGTQYISLSYTDGCYYGCPVYEIYFATTASAIINIETVTSTYIKGTYSATCTGSKGTVQITNGSFKGDF